MGISKLKGRSKASLVCGLFFLLIFSCKSEGNGNGDATKHTLTITKPTDGTLSSDVGSIKCGSKGTTCKAEFSKGTKVTLTATADTGYAPAAWQGNCDKTATDQACKLVMDANKSAGLTFIDPNDIDGDGIPNDTDVDEDNDGLIEVHNLDMFDHIRHSLAGTSYKTGADAKGNTRGAPTGQTDNCKTATDGAYLCGYELAKNLDFADGTSYANGSVNTDWRPNNEDTSSATNEGFAGAIDFAGIFEGNGHSISNLYSRETTNAGATIGLFICITEDATIRNLEVANAHLHGGTGVDYIGGLVGYSQGRISASYATGGTINISTRNDRAGGLVGDNSGKVIASYATGDVNGDAGTNQIGGLVGWNSDDGNISASYATGDVNDGAGPDEIGGLVGLNDGNISTSYATGDVNGDGSVGGLVGNNSGKVIASYATGDVNGGAGKDVVGGLVGSISESSASISASYATGAVNGGDGDDRIGALVGDNIALDGNAGNITVSYAFGSKTEGENENYGSDGDAHPAGVSDATGLTAMNAGSEWNDAGEKTLNAWDFGNNTQAPALKYADYDGSGDAYSCDMFPAKIPGTDTTLVCGTANASLLPEQRP